MKAVARLIWQYFMGTRMSRWFTSIGLALQAIALHVLTTHGQSGGMIWIATLGFISFFVGSAWMPLTFGTLARSHVIGILPNGRLKLLSSAFMTVLLVAIPVAVFAPFAFVAAVGGRAIDLAKHEQLLKDAIHLTQLTFTWVFLFAGWMYLALWFVTSQRNMAGFMKGLLVIALLLFAPAQEIQDLSVSVAWNLQQIAVVWILFGVGFLLWPRIRAARARLSPLRAQAAGRVLPRRTAGREFDLILGTAKPWLLIAAQILPIAISARFVGEIPSVWLFFFVILSTVSGAIAGEAAARSRALWLRGNWTREELFAKIEQSFWRHNGYVLGALLLLMVGVGTYAELPTTTMATGMPLLILATLLSTYLGLMITRGVGWFEAVLAIGVMLALLAVAVLIARESANVGVVLALEGFLAVLTVVLRRMAHRRWLTIDWLMCAGNHETGARLT